MSYVSRRLQECESDWLLTAHPPFSNGSASPSALATPLRFDRRFGVLSDGASGALPLSASAAGCPMDQPQGVQKRVHYGVPECYAGGGAGIGVGVGVAAPASDRSSTCSSTIAHHCTCGLFGQLAFCGRTTPSHLTQRQQPPPRQPLPLPQAEYLQQTQQPAPPPSGPCYIAPDARFQHVVDPLSRATQRFTGDLRGISPPAQATMGTQGYPPLNAAQQLLHLQTGSCSPPDTTSGPSSASSSTQPQSGTGALPGSGPPKPRLPTAAVGGQYQRGAGASGPAAAVAHAAGQGPADRSLEQALSPKTASSLDSGCGLSGTKGERGSSGGSSTSSHAGAGGLRGGTSRGGSGGPLSPLANAEPVCSNNGSLGYQSLANRALTLPIAAPYSGPAPVSAQWPSPPSPGCHLSSGGRRPLLPRLTEESGTASTCTTGTGPVPTIEDAPGPPLPLTSAAEAESERERVHVFPNAIDAAGARLFRSSHQ